MVDEQRVCELELLVRTARARPVEMFESTLASIDLTVEFVSGDCLLGCHEAPPRRRFACLYQVPQDGVAGDMQNSGASICLKDPTFPCTTAVLGFRRTQDFPISRA